MRINHLTIANFKNLHNFTINFKQEFFQSAILGRNGTGKSNLLEALIIIFRDLDLGRPPQFKYQMSYICRDRTITVDADPDRSGESVRIGVDDIPLPYAQFSAQPDRPYLPGHVIGYYSGPSNRMASHFSTHQNRLYIDLIKGIDTEHSSHSLLYAQLMHSQFTLLSLLSLEDPIFMGILREHLGIERLDSVLFVLRKPSWIHDRSDFWNVGGEVGQLLERLSALALAPSHIPQGVDAPPNPFMTGEHLYLYLLDKAAVRELAKLYGDDPLDLFQALERASISGILSDLRIQVQSSDGLPFTLHLSEGEQELLMVLGLLRITRSDEALFLLDEPDNHLNPALSTHYVDLLRKVASPQQTSQIIMTTHSPIIVANLDRLQIYILHRDMKTGVVRTERPYDSPTGLGFSTILLSDFFDLNSTLDLSTQELVNQRRELAVQDVLTEQEREKLSDLNTKLRMTDASISSDHDALLHDLIMEYTRRAESSLRKSSVLTPEQRKQKRALIRAIIKELKEKGEL